MGYLSSPMQADTFERSPVKYHKKPRTCIDMHEVRCCVFVLCDYSAPVSTLPDFSAKRSIVRSPMNPPSKVITYSAVVTVSHPLSLATITATSATKAQKRLLVKNKSFSGILFCAIG